MDTMQPEQLAVVFGQNVRKRRKELRLTQEALAEKTKIPQPYISAVESGKRCPNLSTVAQIAEALGIPPSHLLSVESLAAISVIS